MRRLVVCATGDLAIPVLEGVVEAGHELSRLIAQPARGREEVSLLEERQGSALASWAKRRKVEVRRTKEPGGDRTRAWLETADADLGLVVAFGRRFPTSLLDVPRHGWIKVHFSLLPKHRGLHPIRAALWHGDRQTGATAIRVTEEPDAGPILLQEKLTVEDGETFGELAPRVAALAADLVVPAIRRGTSKSPKVRQQNEKKATTSPRFGRRHRHAPWWLEARSVADRLRALSPDPGMTTRVGGQVVRILQGAPADHLDSTLGEAGSYLGLRSGAMVILCGAGTTFTIGRLQPEGERALSASRYVRERGLRVGTVLV